MVLSRFSLFSYFTVLLAITQCNYVSVRRVFLSFSPFSSREVDHLAKYLAMRLALESQQEETGESDLALSRVANKSNMCTTFLFFFK